MEKTRVLSIKSKPKDGDLRKNEEFKKAYNYETISISSLYTDSTVMSTRVSYDKDIYFILSCVGFCVGLGNIWRFPFKVLSNGGGSYIIAYLISLLGLALPLFFIEVSLGQFTSRSITSCWNFIPGLHGIGYTMLSMSLFCSIYYNVIIAWAIYYFFLSFFRTLPWLQCDHDYNDANCISSAFNGTLIVNVKYYEMSTEQFFDRHIATRIFVHNGTSKLRFIGGDPESFNWPITIALFIAWLLCGAVLFIGIKGSAKIMYFFTLFPYLVIIIMIICGSQLNGSGNGLLLYITPNIKYLKLLKTWFEAAEQIFFSLGIGFGSLITFGSYNNFHCNIFRYTLLIGFINSGTSLISAISVFQIIGFMQYRYNSTIDDLERLAGSGLIFIAYPEGLSTFPSQNILLILFFLMVICLGIDSQIGMMECAVTGIIDGFPNIRLINHHREIIIIITHILCFLIGLIFTTKTGYYWFIIVSKYSVSVNLFIVGLFECIVIGYIYGIQNYDRDIKMMLNNNICLFWKICILIPIPLTLSVLIIFTFSFDYVTIVGNNYNRLILPWWSDFLGNLLCLLTLIPIPICLILFCVGLMKKENLTLIRAMHRAFIMDETYGPAELSNWKLHYFYNIKYKYLVDIGKVKERLSRINSNIKKNIDDLNKFYNDDGNIKLQNYDENNTRMSTKLSITKNLRPSRQFSIILPDKDNERKSLLQSPPTNLEKAESKNSQPERSSDIKIDSKKPVQESLSAKLQNVDSKKSSQRNSPDINIEMTDSKKPSQESPKPPRQQSRDTNLQMIESKKPSQQSHSTNLQKSDSRKPPQQKSPDMNLQMADNKKPTQQKDADMNVQKVHSRKPPQQKSADMDVQKVDSRKPPQQKSADMDVQKVDSRKPPQQKSPDMDVQKVNSKKPPQQKSPDMDVQKVDSRKPPQQKSPDMDVQKVDSRKPPQQKSPDMDVQKVNSRKPPRQKSLDVDVQKVDSKKPSQQKSPDMDVQKMDSRISPQQKNTEMNLQKVNSRKPPQHKSPDMDVQKVDNRKPPQHKSPGMDVQKVDSRKPPQHKSPDIDVQKVDSRISPQQKSPEMILQKVNSRKPPQHKSPDMDVQKVDSRKPPQHKSPDMNLQKVNSRKPPQRKGADINIQKTNNIKQSQEKSLDSNLEKVNEKLQKNIDTNLKKFNNKKPPRKS